MRNAKSIKQDRLNAVRAARSEYYLWALKVDPVAVMIYEAAVAARLARTSNA